MEKIKPWQRSNQIMLDSGFTIEQVWRSQIWAARDHECPKCHAPAYSPCLSLIGIKNGMQFPKENKYPHPDRIDWIRLNTALLERGYRPNV